MFKDCRFGEVRFKADWILVSGVIQAKSGGLECKSRLSYVSLSLFDFPLQAVEKSPFKSFAFPAEACSRIVVLLRRKVQGLRNMLIGEKSRG